MYALYTLYSYVYSVYPVFPCIPCIPMYTLFTHVHPVYQTTQMTLGSQAFNSVASSPVAHDHVLRAKEVGERIKHGRGAGKAREVGRSPFNKNSALNFGKSTCPMKRYILVAQTRPKPPRIWLSFGYRFCKQDTKELCWGQQFCRIMERDISVRSNEMTRSVKVDHLQSCFRIFWSDQTVMVRTIWCTYRNFSFEEYLS